MAEVTQIEKKGKRLIVTVDYREKFNLSYSLLRERPLHVGDTVDLAEFDDWVMLRQYQSALNYAVSLLAMRDHSRGEIVQKLLRRGYRKNTADMVVYKLEKENLLDDGKFAAMWVESRKYAGAGVGKITRELRLKGVAQEKIENAMERLSDEDQLEGALKLVKKAVARAKENEPRQKTRSRVIAMLARHGYSYDIARSAFDAAMEGHDEDE